MGKHSKGPRSWDRNTRRTAMEGYARAGMQGKRARKVTLAEVDAMLRVGSPAKRPVGTPVPSHHASRVFGWRRKPKFSFTLATSVFPPSRALSLSQDPDVHRDRGPPVWYIDHRSGEALDDGLLTRKAEPNSSHIPCVLGARLALKTRIRRVT